jgi:acetoin utilization deacetylase AcuC-like enzyme
MSNYRLYYSPYYYANIGKGHVFPIRKFELVRDLLLREGTLRADEIFETEPAHVEDLLVRRSFHAISGTINAARFALESGISSNLAGGTHHAYPDRGEGFCVLNDVAVAIRVLQREKRAERFLIVDCDVHQGNGTAFIFKDSPEVFTFSMHGAKNYPLFKETSNLDIELADGTGDEEFLETLEQALPRIFMHNPDIIFYLGGADPYEKDKLGRLKLTQTGLMRRDEIVLEFAKERHTPIVTTMSGGYALDINDTVEIHANTIRAVKRVFFEGSGTRAKAKQL